MREALAALSHDDIEVTTGFFFVDPFEDLDLFLACDNHARC
ncbi:hypothetical protein [Mycobacterium sp. 852002-51057_SCH5723018]|nr:hypothetical protein [Mycobacterium sp. 852002-51057_SCH5723018]